MDTHYLNNTGSRWIICKPGTREKVKVTIRHEGAEYTRTALYFEAWGNFTAVCVSIGGKKIKTLYYAFVDN